MKNTTKKEFKSERVANTFHQEPRGGFKEAAFASGSDSEKKKNDKIIEMANERGLSSRRDEDIPMKSDTSRQKQEGSDSPKKSLGIVGQLRKRFSKKIMSPKIEVLVKSMLQPLVFFVYFHENCLGGDPQMILIPMICFMVGGVTNIGLVLFGHWSFVFMGIHSLLMGLSLLLAILGNSQASAELDSEQQHSKMVMALLYFCLLLTTKLNLQGNSQNAAMGGVCVFLAVCYQILFFRSARDFIAMAILTFFGLVTIWQYQRILEDLTKINNRNAINLQNSGSSSEGTNQALKIYQSALREGIKDGVFFATLEGIDQHLDMFIESSATNSSSLPRLYFYEKSFRLQAIFNLSSGLDSILGKMQLFKKEQIIQIQKKAIKLLRDPQLTFFEAAIKKIMTPSHSLIHGTSSNQQRNNQNSAATFQQQQQYSYNINSHNNNDSQSNLKQTPPILSGLENAAWNLKQLQIFVQLVRQAQKQPFYDEKSAAMSQIISHFNLQEILFLSFFTLKRKAQKKQEVISKTMKHSQFQQEFKDLEFKYISGLYTAQIFSCPLKDQHTLFVSLAKNSLNNTNSKIQQQQYQQQQQQLQPQSDENISDLTSFNQQTVSLLKFFRSRSEKLSKAITSCVCKLDCLGKSDYLDGENNKITEATNIQVKRSYEYVRLIVKDTEEYRELLEDEVQFGMQDSQMSRDEKLKISQRNVSRFSFNQVLEDVRNIFAGEVQFKSTQISLISESYLKEEPTSGQNLNPSEKNNILISDYEKVKRVLVTLIENSLTYQKAGTIEIKIQENTRNVLQVTIIDNQCLNLSDEELEIINRTGSSSQKGYGFAIVSALLQVLQPSNLLHSPLQIKKDRTNDKTNVIFWIAKTLEDRESNTLIEQQQQQSRVRGASILPQKQSENKKKGEISVNAFMNASNQQLAIDNLILEQMKALNDPQMSMNLKYASEVIVNPDKPSTLFQEYQLTLKNTLLLRNLNPSDFLDIFRAGFKSCCQEIPKPSITKTLPQIPETSPNPSSEEPSFRRLNTTQALQDHQSNNNDIQSPNSNNNNQAEINQTIIPANPKKNDNNSNNINNNNSALSWGHLGSNKNIQLARPQFLVVSSDFRLSASLVYLLIEMTGDKQSVKYAPNRLSLSDLLTRQIFEFIIIDSLEGVTLKDVFKEINLIYKHRKQLQKIIFFDFTPPHLKNLEAQIPLLASQDLAFNNSFLPKNIHLKDDSQLWQQQQNYYKLQPSQYAFPSNRPLSQHKELEPEPSRNNAKRDIPKLQSEQFSSEQSHFSVSIPSENNYNRQTAGKMKPRYQQQYSLKHQSNEINTNDLKQEGTDNINKNIQQQQLCIDTSRIEQQDISRQEIDETSRMDLMREQSPIQRTKQPITKQFFEQMAHNKNPKKLNSKKQNPSSETQIKSPLSSKSSQQGRYANYLPPHQKEQEVPFIQSYMMSNVKSQDIAKTSFLPKYNESIEVASSLKFAYYSLEHPFGYAQILEAIGNLSFSLDLIHLNNNFFNLNKPDLYFSRMA